MSEGLPISLQRHSAYQAEYYARLHQLHDFDLAAPIIESFLRAIVASGHFYLRVHQRTLPLILESERIKGMVETGTGTTTGGPEVRRQTTRELFDCDLSRMCKSDFPKYGYLSVPDAKYELFIGDEMSFQFGNALLTLNKERLMNRTTMTVGMVLSHNISSYIIPTRTNNILATCLPGLPHDKDTPYNPRRAASLYIYFANSILRRRITLDNYHRITEILGNDVPSFEFFELQYHGTLDLLTDVERIDTYADGDAATLADMKTAFEGKGIPFYIHEL